MVYGHVQQKYLVYQFVSMDVLGFGIQIPKTQLACTLKYYVFVQKLQFKLQFVCTHI